VFENRAQRRIFCSRRDKVRGNWRKLRNEELSDLYSSPNIILVIKSPILRFAGHVECMGARRGAYRDLVRKPEGKRPLGSPRCRWEENIKMDLQEVEREAWNVLIWLRIGKDGELL
jgi:hypothetical protein